MLNKAVDAHEGCVLEGWLDLRKVAGNFKISIHMDDYFMLRKVGVTAFPLRHVGFACVCLICLSSTVLTPAVVLVVLFSAFSFSCVVRLGWRRLSAFLCCPYVEGYALGPFMCACARAHACVLGGALASWLWRKAYDMLCTHPCARGGGGRRASSVLSWLGSANWRVRWISSCWAMEEGVSVLSPDGCGFLF
jgi:hypothetical protein